MGLYNEKIETRARIPEELKRGFCIPKYCNVTRYTCGIGIWVYIPEKLEFGFVYMGSRKSGLHTDKKVKFGLHSGGIQTEIV